MILISGAILSFDYFLGAGGKKEVNVMSKDDVALDKKTIVSNEKGYMASYSDDTNFVMLRIPVGTIGLHRIAWVHKNDLVELADFVKDVDESVRRNGD